MEKGGLWKFHGVWGLEGDVVGGVAGGEEGGLVCQGGVMSLWRNSTLDEKRVEGAPRFQN